MGRIVCCPHWGHLQKIFFFEKFGKCEERKEKKENIFFHLSRSRCFAAETAADFCRKQCDQMSE